MRWIALLLFLTGCGAMERSEMAQQAKTDLIGMSRDQILFCMGPPTAMVSEGNIDMWGYQATDTKTTGGYIYNFGTFSYGGAVTKERWCNVSIGMVDGIVQQVNYNGKTGGLMTPDSACYYAVQHCLH